MIKTINELTLNQLINLLDREWVQLNISGYHIQFKRSDDRKTYTGNRGRDMVKEFGDRKVNRILMCTERMAEIELGEIDKGEGVKNFIIGGATS